MLLVKRTLFKLLQTFSPLLSPWLRLSHGSFYMVQLLRALTEQTVFSNKSCSKRRQRQCNTLLCNRKSPKKKTLDNKPCGFFSFFGIIHLKHCVRLFSFLNIKPGRFPSYTLPMKKQSDKDIESQIRHSCLPIVLEQNWYFKKCNCRSEYKNLLLCTPSFMGLAASRTNLLLTILSTIWLVPWETNPFSASFSVWQVTSGITVVSMTPETLLQPNNTNKGLLDCQKLSQNTWIKHEADMDLLLLAFSLICIGLTMELSDAEIKRYRVSMQKYIHLESTMKIW